MVKFLKYNRENQCGCSLYTALVLAPVWVFEKVKLAFPLLTLLHLKGVVIYKYREKNAF